MKNNKKNKMDKKITKRLKLLLNNLEKNKEKIYIRIIRTEWEKNHSVFYIFDKIR